MTCGEYSSIDHNNEGRPEAQTKSAAIKLDHRSTSHPKIYGVNEELR